MQSRFYSMVLINWYLMPNLIFWDGQFHHAPYFLLALGIYKGLTAIYGFVVYNFKDRCLLSIFAILLVIGFAMQMTSIALFWNVRTTILVGEVSGAKIAGMLKDYGHDPEITNSLDYVMWFSSSYTHEFYYEYRALCTIVLMENLHEDSQLLSA